MKKEKLFWTLLIAVMVFALMTRVAYAQDITRSTDFIYGPSDGSNRGGYDNRGYDNRGYNNQKYDERRYDEPTYDKRKYDNRGYDNRGYGNRSYDRQKYDKRKYDNRGYSNADANKNKNYYPPQKKGNYTGKRGYSNANADPEFSGSEKPTFQPRGTNRENDGNSGNIRGQGKRAGAGGARPKPAYKKKSPAKKGNIFGECYCKDAYGRPTAPVLGGPCSGITYTCVKNPSGYWVIQ